MKMNEQKSGHTPGPWKVAGTCHVHETPDGRFYHVSHITVADDYANNPYDPYVAEISSRGRYCSESEAHKPGGEQAANARLIAQSPAMLSALKKAYDELARIADNQAGISEEELTDIARPDLNLIEELQEIITRAGGVS